MFESLFELLFCTGLQPVHTKDINGLIKARIAFSAKLKLRKSVQAKWCRKWSVSGHHEFLLVRWWELGKSHPLWTRGLQPQPHGTSGVTAASLGPSMHTVVLSTNCTLNGKAPGAPAHSLKAARQSRESAPSGQCGKNPSYMCRPALWCAHAVASQGPECYAGGLKGDWRLWKAVHVCRRTAFMMESAGFQYYLLVRFLLMWQTCLEKRLGRSFGLCSPLWAVTGVGVPTLGQQRPTEIQCNHKCKPWHFKISQHYKRQKEPAETNFNIFLLNLKY